MIPRETLAWLHRQLGADLRIADAPLEDTSHTNHRAWLGERELLVRRFTDAELLTSDPWYSPADEIAALEAVRAIAVVTPELVAADVDGAACDVPTLVVTWVPGSTVTPADLPVVAPTLAEPLLAVHAARRVTRAYEPYFVSDGHRLDDMRPPSWSLDASVWMRAFAVASRAAPHHEAVLIHRDYHPGNTVWRDHAVVGVVDWTAACTGPAEIDVAQMRINLAYDAALEAADAFLHAWEALTGRTYDPWWDVLDAVDWLSDPPSSEPPAGGLERYEALVARALAHLGA